MKRNNQRGFSIVEGILVIAIVAILSVVGWYVFQQREDAASSDTTTTTSQQEDVPEVNNAEDLEKSEQFLKETDIDQELDTSEIDSTLDQ